MKTYCGCDDKIDLEWGTDIRPVINVGGSSDYNEISNKPSINGIELVGNKTNEELLIDKISNEEIEQLLK